MHPSFSRLSPAACFASTVVRPGGFDKPAACNPCQGRMNIDSTHSMCNSVDHVDWKLPPRSNYMIIHFDKRQIKTALISFSQIARKKDSLLILQTRACLSVRRSERMRSAAGKSSYHASVLNEEAGNPSLLNNVPSSASPHAYRTAAGFDISGFDTTSFEP
jgi:hypothetical protein